MKLISEIEITPVKMQDGLVGFASFVLFEALYCSSVGIITRLDGKYRLVYPTKKVGMKSMDIFHPITKQLGETIEAEINNKIEKVMNYDRHGSNNSSRKVL